MHTAVALRRSGHDDKEKSAGFSPGAFCPLMFSAPGRLTRGCGAQGRGGQPVLYGGTGV